MKNQESITPEEVKRQGTKRWQLENSEKVKAQKKLWAENNPEKLAAYRDAITPEQQRQYKVKASYGLSWIQYQELYSAFNGQCAICKKELALVKHSTIETASVDHNHKTGEVRGILCRSCNRGIGYLNDSPERLIRAAEYLK